MAGDDIPITTGRDADEQVRRETQDPHGLIFARLLDGEGGARAMEWQEARSWTRPEESAQTLWVHLDRTIDEVEDWLCRDLGIAEQTVEELTSNETAPRAFREDDALVTILRGVNLNPGAEPEDMIAMQIWAEAGRVVTLRRRRLQTPQDVKDQLDKGRGPKTAGDLFAELVEQLVARMGRSIVNINRLIDDLEEQAEDEDADTGDILHETAEIRRRCLSLKRFMSPQHEALQQILRMPPKWLGKANRRDISETIERLRRYLDDLDVSKESAIVLQDELNNRVADQSNKTMYMLSIVAAIFLPLSFVTGLLGINVGGMPGVDDGDAFWITVGVLGLLLIGQVMVFRKIDWL